MSESDIQAVTCQTNLADPADSTAHANRLGNHLNLTIPYPPYFGTQIRMQFPAFCARLPVRHLSLAS